MLTKRQSYQSCLKYRTRIIAAFHHPAKFFKRRNIIYQPSDIKRFGELGHRLFLIFGQYQKIIPAECTTRTVMDRAANRDAVIRLSQQLFEKARSMDVDEVIAALEAADVPCAKANHLGDLPEHPQMQANGLFVESEHPVAGPMVEPKNPVHFSATPSGCGFASAMLGQHSDEILAELGYGDDAISMLRDRGVIG